MVLLSTLALLFVSFLIIYFYIKHKQNYWKNLKIPYVQPHFPLGNFNGLGKSYHTYELFTKFYYELKGQGQFGGIFFLTKPFLICLDLDFIKNILIRDFDYFVNRDMYYNEKHDPLSANLLTLEEQRWKSLRKKLTPTFTTAKMKFMFPTMKNISNELVEVLIKESSSNLEVEMKEILARYTTDVIGTCAFGIECNSLKDPNAQFRKMGKEVTTAPNLSQVARFITRAWPNIARAIHVKLFDSNVTRKFATIIKEIVSYRESANVTRNDFIDLLIGLKNSQSTDKYLSQFNDDNVAAEALILFLGGFETSSTLLSFCLYELGQSMEIQQKVRDEVVKVLQAHNGEFSYEAMTECTYMDQVLNETLRKYPPVDLVSRRANLDYSIPGTNIVLKRGQSMVIPVYQIHHDPDYYPNPSIFDPSRFSVEETGKRHSMTFLPFGEGPRNCIGLRLGLNQSKIALANMVLNFKFELSAKMEIPAPISKVNQFMTIDGGLWLKMVKIT